MQLIRINNSLPAVFAGREEDSSEVWLRDISFEKGKKYLISAESGTGKSSLCSYIYGYREDYSGEIFFDGKNVRTFTVKEWCNIRCTALAYIPQELRLFTELTAMENVELKNRLTGYKSRKEIELLFENVGIPEKMDSEVGKMSIGQQQRVAIIRALCQPFDFILLDEPVSHLDNQNNRVISELVMSEALKQGAGIISTSVGNNLLITVDKELKL